PLPISSETASATTSRGAKELLEKVAEPGPTELKVVVLPRSSAAASGAAAETFPSGRWPEFRALLPIRAEFVVLFALGRITQDFVSLVDFFELVFGLFLILGNVRVVLTRQLAESFLDLVVARSAWHAKQFIIIFELNGHLAISVLSRLSASDEIN